MNNPTPLREAIEALERLDKAIENLATGEPEEDNLLAGSSAETWATWLKDDCLKYWPEENPEAPYSVKSLAGWLIGENFLPVFVKQLGDPATNYGWSKGIHRYIRQLEKEEQK